jgi:hypothetical protein
MREKEYRRDMNFFACNAAERGESSKLCSDFPSQIELP